MRRPDHQLPPVTTGWNYAVRLCRPRPEILNGIGNPGAAAGEVTEGTNTARSFRLVTAK
jgi:hypothetical protein